MLKPRFTPFQHLGELLHGEQCLLPEPRCCTFATVATVVGIASGLAGIGGTIAGAVSGGPQYPNEAASSAQMAETEAELLPLERQMQAQAQLGGSVVLPGYTTQTLSADQAASQRSDIQSQIQSLQDKLNPKGPFAALQGSANRHQIQSQIAALQTKLQGIPEAGGTIYMDKSGNIVPAQQASQSFAGLGTADIEGQIMQELAQGQLTEAQKMDPQFIAEALAQEQQADPQSFAARQQMYDLIQQQINNPPQSPVSNEMEKQVEAKVNAGQNLTPDEQSLLDTVIAQRGGTSAPADFSKDLTTGFAGEQRGLANATAGTNWLASGETPEDIQYRAQQQDLANLSSYVTGKTPQSQFGSLSGAQQGPTPVTSSPALPTLPGNAQQLGAQGASAQYGAQLGQASASPNPWMAGLSGLLGVGNTLGAAGYQPFAP